MHAPQSGILDLPRTPRRIIDPADYERRLPIAIAWLLMFSLAAILWVAIWAVLHWAGLL